MESGMLNGQMEELRPSKQPTNQPEVWDLPFRPVQARLVLTAL